MVMNANSSLATYGQLPESLACAEQVDGLYRRVNDMAAYWWVASAGLVRDVTVSEFHTDGRYRIAVDFDGTVAEFPDEEAAGGWIERMGALGRVTSIEIQAEGTYDEGVLSKDLRHALELNASLAQTATGR